jgi:hypothetical protein
MSTHFGLEFMFIENIVSSRFYSMEDFVFIFIRFSTNHCNTSERDLCERKNDVVLICGKSRAKSIFRNIQTASSSFDTLPAVVTQKEKA